MRSRLENVLAKRLRELSREKRIPLSHVADRAGVSRSYFWLLLDGENSATLALVQRIAEALDVEPLELLTPKATEMQPVAAEPVKRMSSRARGRGRNK